MSLTVELIDMLHVNDNYNFMLRDEAHNLTAIIDPSEGEGVLDALSNKGWKLDYILNTHFHWDHTNGNKKVKENTGCQVVGFKEDAHRIPEIDIELEEGAVFEFGDYEIEVISIPGHVQGHIAFYIPKAKALFSGDTIFALGCGRIFEGNAQQYYESIEKIKALPDDTIIYSAHEYTIANARFARSVEPENSDLADYVARAKQKRKANQPSIPTTLAEEKACNPFLRPHSPEIRGILEMANASDAEVFAELRRRKDSF